VFLENVTHVRFPESDFMPKNPVSKRLKPYRCQSQGKEKPNLTLKSVRLPEKGKTYRFQLQVTGRLQVVIDGVFLLLFENLFSQKWIDPFGACKL
jgi:hypothetical protein